MLLSIVIPCYNEEEVIQTTINTLLEVFDKNLKDDKYELIFVNDGSKDKTLEILKENASKKENIKIVSFSRNFGHQKALRAGLDHTKGDAIAIIDADLQDPPEIILEMLEKWKEGYEIIYGQRKSREGETFFKKQTSKWFYRIINTLSEIQMPLDTGEFRLVDRKVLDVIKSMPEQQKYLRGSFSWVGFKTIPVYFERKARQAGETKYNLKAMIKLASDGIFTFSNKPLKFPLLIGVLILLISSIGLLFSLFTLNIENIKYFSLLFILGLSFMSNFITNKYVENISDNVKERPQYIVDELINFK